MDYTREELSEAKKQIASTVNKLKKSAATLENKDNAERYKSQITLAKRRIAAFEIALGLIDKEIDKNL